MQPSVSKPLRFGGVAFLLGLGFFLQFHFLRAYPQPILFGDPGAYYVVGQKLQQAVSRLLTGEDIGTVFESVRGLLYFAGVGSLYGLIDALSPQNIPYFRVVLSGFNTLAMLGCFFLAKRLSSYAGGISALVLAVLYAPFSVQTGRLFPDPVTGCLFVWSAYLYIRGIQDRGWLSMFGAGVALTAALFVRSQLFDYVLILLALVLVSTLAWWWRSQRRLVLALVLGCLPWTAVWLGIVRVVGDDLEQIEAFGNFTFQQRYPYGFWQFLDSDGWMGPYRLEQEPYYRALEARATEEPELLESYPRQLLFTASYVLSRPVESALLVADNAYRLYDRPANDYKWDYPIPYRAQVRYQQLLVLAALAMFAVLVAEHTSWAFVFFVPASLALLHGLSYPWPRFNQPAMPILIAASGAFVTWAVRHRPGHYGPLIAVGGAAAFLWASGTFLRMPAPELARVLRSTGTLLGLALPFVFVALPLGDRRRTLAAMACFLGLAAFVSANDLRSPRWHETSVTLGRAEQEISLSDDALRSLHRASETFIVLDLLIPDGDPRGVQVSIDGRNFPSDALVPTMPRFGESTSAGGRNRREYRQWWALRLTPGDLPATAPAVFRIVVEAPERDDVVLYGDRFRDQERVYEGPSFGDWPHLAQVKLEYDGDYRLPVRIPLRSAATESDYAGVHRIRLITLSQNVGRLLWETAPVVSGPVAVPFYAYTGSRGEAQLLVDGETAVSFPLGSETDFEIEAPPFRLCYRPEEPRADMPYGGYVLSMDADEGVIPLQIRFTSGMSIERMFTSLDTRRTSAEELADLAARCAAGDGRAIASFGRIVEAETNSYPADTGRWSVEGVF